MDKINSLFSGISSNNFFIGFMMLMLNIGSKYMTLELSPLQNNFLNSKIVRRIIIFSVFFMATKDIWVSFILTAVFIVLVFGLFNEKSKFCILPKSIVEISKYDLNKDNKLSAEEIKYAYLDLRSKGAIT